MIAVRAILGNAPNKRDMTKHFVDPSSLRLEHAILVPTVPSTLDIICAFTFGKTRELADD